MDITALDTFLNLADAQLGTEVVYVTDDWFAEASRMLNPEPAVWKEGVYDDNGKWMDGWESRRKRFEGYDYAVIRLGVPGYIKGIEIDTRFFTGNYPPSASVMACFCPDDDLDDKTNWQTVLPSVNLQGDHQVRFLCDDHQPWTHVRLNIYPDGGIARFKVFGVPFRDWSETDANEIFDLAAAVNGGRALSCSDQHYGKMSNILNPGRAVNMGGGWETARRRVPGNDWVIVALGHPGVIEKVLVDTLHFKGNYPDECSLQAAYVEGGTEDQIATRSLYWRELMSPKKLQMNQEHEFDASVLKELGPVTHVKLNIFPDGGVSRLQLFGKIMLN